MDQITVEAAAEYAYNRTKVSRPDLLAALQYSAEKYDWDWGLTRMELEKSATIRKFSRDQWADLYLVFIHAQNLAEPVCNVFRGYAEL